MQPNELIVWVRGERGSFALYGLRTKTGWLFSLDVIDSGAASLDEAPSDGKVVSSWSDALNLLDSYPWRQSWPEMVHPEFRVDVLKAVQARPLSTEHNQPEYSQLPYRERWEDLCSAPPDDPSKYQVETEEIDLTKDGIKDGASRPRG